jgi:hypothetical protein
MVKIMLSSHHAEANRVRGLFTVARARTMIILQLQGQVKKKVLVWKEGEN